MAKRKKKQAVFGIQNPYDHALKMLARAYPAELLALGFPDKPIRLLGTLSNVELALEIDRVDFLHQIELAGEKAYCHIDFQLDHTLDCGRRYFVYNGMMTEVYKPLPIITLPVYLRPRQKEIPAVHEVKVGEVVFHRFTYQPLKLWDYVDQIRSGDLYIFAPLLPLLVEPMDEALLIEERELILSHESDPARQKLLLTTSILIAAQQKIFNSDFLWELFKEDTMDFDNPVIAKLFEKHFGAQLAEQVEERVHQEVQQKLTVAIQQLNEANRREMQQRETEFRLKQAEADAARREAEAEAARREVEAEAARREAEVKTQWQQLMLKLLENRFQTVPPAILLLLQNISSAQRNQASDIIFAAPDAQQCLQSLRQLTQA